MLQRHERNYSSVTVVLRNPTFKKKKKVFPGVSADLHDDMRVFLAQRWFKDEN